MWVELVVGFGERELGRDDGGYLAWSGQVRKGGFLDGVGLKGKGNRGEVVVGKEDDGFDVVCLRGQAGRRRNLGTSTEVVYILCWGGQGGRHLR